MEVSGVSGKELAMVKGMKLRRILGPLFLSELISSRLGCYLVRSFNFRLLECLTVFVRVVALNCAYKERTAMFVLILL